MPALVDDIVYRALAYWPLRTFADSSLPGELRLHPIAETLKALVMGPKINLSPTPICRYGSSNELLPVEFRLEGGNVVTLPFC